MKVKFYSLPTLKGKSIDLGYGSYTYSELSPLIDNIGSFTLPSRVAVTLYSADNFTGLTKTFTNDTHRFKRITCVSDIFDNPVNSLKIDCACFKFPKEPHILSINKYLNKTMMRNGQEIGYTYFSTVIKNNNVLIKSKPKIIMILDFGHSSYQYRCVQENFAAKGYDSLIVDLRGMDNSAPSDNMSFDELIEDFRYVASNLKFLNGSNKAVLIGFGLGGAIAQKWALLYKFELYKLILVDSAPYNTYSVYSKINDITSNWVRGTSSLEDYAKVLADTTFTGSSGYCDLEKLNMDLYNNILNEDEISLKRLIVQTADDASRPDQAKHILAPTLILYGAEDALMTVEGSKKLNELIKGSKMRQVKGSGHAPQLSWPDLFFYFTFDFIN